MGAHRQGEMPQITLQPPTVLEVDDSERDLIQQHRTQLEKWSWRCTVLTDADALCRSTHHAPAASHIVSLTSVPVVRSVPLRAVDFLEHLHQLKDTHGATTRPPPGVLRVLNSVACRGAIMFGDWLSDDQCKDLIRDLSGCSHPFQCAHGRPSMVPLVHMPAVHKQTSSGATWQRTPNYSQIQRNLDTAPLW